MSTLITGGNGFIGWRVAKRLLEHGDRVVLLDVTPPSPNTLALAEQHGERLAFTQGDVMAIGNVGDIIKQHGVTRILHLAYVLGSEANANPGLATNVNLVGTNNVLDLATLLDVPRVVLASSIAVFGNDDRYPAEALPLTEEAAPFVASPVPLYGAGKIYMEQLAALYREQHGLDVTCLRPSIVYGPGRRTGATGFLVTMVEDAAAGKPVQVPGGDAKMSLIYVEDIADQFTALVEASESTLGDHYIFNSGGDTCTMQELVDAVRELLPDATITVGDSKATDVAGLAATVSGAALEHALGFKRHYSPVTEGIRALISAARA